MIFLFLIAFIASILGIIFPDVSLILTIAYLSLAFVIIYALLAPIKIGVDSFVDYIILVAFILGIPTVLGLGIGLFLLNWSLNSSIFLIVIIMCMLLGTIKLLFEHEH